MKWEITKRHYYTCKRFHLFLKICLFVRKFYALSFVIPCEMAKIANFGLPTRDGRFVWCPHFSTERECVKISIELFAQIRFCNLQIAFFISIYFRAFATDSPIPTPRLILLFHFSIFQAFFPCPSKKIQYQNRMWQVTYTKVIH